PPLNTYQLRLPARNLMERDALLLRLGSELSVDAIVIEETSPENNIESDMVERERSPKNNARLAPAPNDNEWAANHFFDAVDFYRRRIPAKSQPVKTQPVRIGVIERNVDFDSPDFADYVGDCRSGELCTCLYASDAGEQERHGSIDAGKLATVWDNGGNNGSL